MNNLKEVIERLDREFEESGYFNFMAEWSKKGYDAFRSVGFNTEEALQLTASLMRNIKTKIVAFVTEK